MTWSMEDPFSVKVFSPILEPKFFLELLKQFPPIQELLPYCRVGYKYSVSDGKRGKNAFQGLIAGRPAWRQFYKSFVLEQDLLQLARRYFHILNGRRIKQRTEFSILPGDGGHITPHPDTEKKLVTAVVYFPDPDWQEEWGGEFAMVCPTGIVDLVGYPRVEFNDVVVVHKVPYRPNTVVFMERSEKSFHAVFPIKAPAGHDRKSITINFMGRP